jgi:hypothetical protein
MKRVILICCGENIKQLSVIFVTIKSKFPSFTPLRDENTNNKKSSLDNDLPEKRKKAKKHQK